MEKPTSPVEELVASSKRISRGRALRILALLVRGREIMIQTHSEPETLRSLYQSNWVKQALNGPDRNSLDPIGRIAWLRDVAEIIDELGAEDLEISEV